MAAPDVVISVSARRRQAVLFSACLALVLVVAGVSMLNVALPKLATDLAISQSQQQWIVDAYAVALAALLLPAGALGDRFGRRGALVGGIALFGVASVLGATAHSANLLIAYRALAGVGAALIMPGTLSSITSVFPAEERARAVGVWAGFAGAGGMLGILGSGALLEHFWWGSVFVLNGALAAVALVAVALSVPPNRNPDDAHLDPFGALLAVAGIGALVLGITEGPERGWTSPMSLTGLVVGAIATAGFVWWELRTPTPLLDPRLFRNRGFATGSAALFLMFLAMFGFFYVALQYLQLGLHYGTLKAGVAILPMAAVVLPVSAVSATLSERLGQRLIGTVGLVISAIGMTLFLTMHADSGYLGFLLPLLVTGLGFALAMTPATNAIVSSLPAEKQGIASAMNDTARELGSALGVALMGSAFNVGYRNDIDTHLAGLPAGAAHLAREAPAGALAVANRLHSAALADVARGSFVAGLRFAVLFAAGLLVVGALYNWVRSPGVVEDILDESLEEELEPALA
jgi:EmrB/QacA subfamily drug resistance transporter